MDDPTNDWVQTSRTTFKGILQRVWLPTLERKQIRHITASDLIQALATAVAQYKFKHDDKEPAKSTYNRWLLCARGVFALATKAGAILPVEDPTQHLKNKTRNKTDADPFDVREANLIIAAAYAQHHDTIGAWFELGFYSGMRYPSEPAALTWDDIDLRKFEARIEKIMTRAGVQHSTKTKTARLLYLNSRSRNALQRLHALPRGTSPDSIPEFAWRADYRC